MTLRTTKTYSLSWGSCRRLLKDSKSTRTRIHLMFNVWETISLLRVKLPSYSHHILFICICWGNLNTVDFNTQEVSTLQCLLMFLFVGPDSSKVEHASYSRRYKHTDRQTHKTNIQKNQEKQWTLSLLVPHTNTNSSHRNYKNLSSTAQIHLSSPADTGWSPLADECIPLLFWSSVTFISSEWIL